MRTLFFILMAITFAACNSNNPTKRHKTDATLSADITPGDIRTHIRQLSGDSLHRRETGSAGEAMAARYIADYFKAFDLHPSGDDSTYYQQFAVDMSQQRTLSDADTSASPEGKRISRNVIGVIKGITKSNVYIVIGAHYDQSGAEQFDSRYSHRNPKIYNSADDNASGISGMLELAQYFSSHKPEKNLLFVAFSGEELGLLGSQHFIAGPVVPLKQIQAMINMGMIGRLKNNKLTIFDTGTSDDWPSLIKKANTDSLQISMVPEGNGTGDYTSFYSKNIPVLHYFTGDHTDYHHPPNDTIHLNFKGEDRILEHLKRLVETIDTLSTNQLAYKKALTNEQDNILLKGPTLGVMPDYKFKGTGMRITNVDKGGPAYHAGLQSGDIIIRLNGEKLKDIYKYMDVLNTLKKGDRTTVTVKRNHHNRTFDITL